MVAAADVRVGYPAADLVAVALDGVRSAQLRRVVLVVGPVTVAAPVGPMVAAADVRVGDPAADLVAVALDGVRSAQLRRVVLVADPVTVAAPVGPTGVVHLTVVVPVGLTAVDDPPVVQDALMGRDATHPTVARTPDQPHLARHRPAPIEGGDGMPSSDRRGRQVRTAHQIAARRHPLAPVVGTRAETPRGAQAPAAQVDRDRHREGVPATTARVDRHGPDRVPVAGLAGVGTHVMDGGVGPVQVRGLSRLVPVPSHAPAPRAGHRCRVRIAARVAMTANRDRLTRLLTTT
jgi:hypothetical protein